MKVTAKLFKLEWDTIPEWGKSYDNAEEYILADSVEDVKEHLANKRNIYLDQNLVYEKYFSMDRESIRYTLVEVEVTIL